MVFVRYIHDGKILDDFLFCRGLTSRTTAHDVLNVVSDFFYNLRFKLEERCRDLHRRCSSCARLSFWIFETS